jgi:DNA-binding NtrC family response regulator
MNPHALPWQPSPVVATTAEFKISQLSNELDATNGNIKLVATTLEMNISQLSSRLDATNSNITSVAMTLERNVSHTVIYLA